MNEPEIQAVLQQLLAGRLTPDAAVQRLLASAGQLGFAHVDLDRPRRCGFPEVIYCEGKTCEWIESVVRRLAESNQACLATRVNPAQAEHLARVFPQGRQDRLARTFWLPAGSSNAPVGEVAVITAGTSDLPVAQEASVTIEALGSKPTLIADVGVAGIHRLLKQQERFIHADAIVVVAGMDGALPSVVGGLVDAPVIAVPTSVGYGASFGGVAALLTMLNACPANVVVVNIDSGFKGGYVASVIARRRRATQ
jgi:pyridinium-3,5-biscarboxylic acid mononucleotide synthase